MSTPEAPEILQGYKAIARFLGLTPRQVMIHVHQGRLPTFRLGRAVCARPKTLLRWLNDQENMSRN